MARVEYGMPGIYCGCGSKMVFDKACLISDCQNCGNKISEEMKREGVE